MGNFSAELGRWAFYLYFIALHLFVGFLLVDKYILPSVRQTGFDPETAGIPVIEATPFPTLAPESSPAPLPTQTEKPIEIPSQASLLIPVKGVRKEQLMDTFGDARSEGRSHDAIDIPAPLGTPVIAAADGEIVKFHDSDKGGITIYQISADRKYFFYYAHLQDRDSRVSEKMFVKAGTILGSVGDTGNAGKGNYHLHFAITVANDSSRFWEGVSINPYQILKGDAVLQ